jgi:hypothetical protein
MMKKINNFYIKVFTYNNRNYIKISNDSRKALWYVEIFIQDTNALALKAIPSVLGVSRKNNW